MKCPFRTIKTTESVVDKDTFSPTYGKVAKEIETIDFSECIGEGCPYHYYGVEVDTSSGWNTHKTKSVPKCKRAEV